MVRLGATDSDSGCNNRQMASEPAYHSEIGFQVIACFFKSQRLQASISDNPASISLDHI